MAFTVNTPGSASFDPVRGTRTCVGAGAVCDTGLRIAGRGTHVEPQAPNTLFGSCADNNAGRYHGDESIDRIRIATTDGSPLAPGKTVRVDVSVWNSSYDYWHPKSADYWTWSDDGVQILHAADANNPVWTLWSEHFATGPGPHTYSATFVLPQGGVQAIRALIANYTSEFGYGPPLGCPDRNYYKPDVDDLVFTVGSATP